MVLSFFIALLIAPLSGWGFSSESVLTYQKQASEKKLWQDSQWLKLGHYRQKITGGYSSPLQGSFFVSPQGAHDPQAELLATLELLFRSPEEGSQAQCRYLARTAWLKQVLNISSQDLASCPARDLWRQQLGANEIYLVFASSDLSSAGSSFGHTFLRVHNPKNTKNIELLDYGINYAAVTGEDSGALYALKGLFGFYAGAYSMLPYYQKMREYTNLEGRNLWEYKLNLTVAEVHFLIDHLLELEGSYAPYYFTDDNCSQQILELIEVAKPELNIASKFHDITIPLDTVKALKNENMLLSENIRPSLQSDWRQRYASLNTKQKEALKTTIEKGKQAELEALSTKEKAEMLETALSYFAIQEYREQKDLKEIKYPLSLARAQLGPQTEPLILSKPASPLSSSASVAWYFGYGQWDQLDYFNLKWRRAFHDLLSDDSSLSPFSHLEMLSLDFRYFTVSKNFDLQKLTLLKIFSSSPVNLLDTPLTWRLDLGSEPKLSPYFHFAGGLSFDSDALGTNRLSLLAVSENYHLSDRAESWLGLETLLMTKFRGLRGLLALQGLYHTQEARTVFNYRAGLSWSVSQNEIRLEGHLRDHVPEWNISVIF